MPLAYIYWILMLLWLVWGIRRKALPEAIPFLLFLILGWVVLGEPVQ